MMRGYVYYPLVEFIGGPVATTVEKFRHVLLILPDILLLADLAMRDTGHLHRITIALLLVFA